MRIPPNALLRDIRPDEVAECWDGIDSPLHAALRRSMETVPAWSGETPPEPGRNSVAEHWHSFSDDEKLALNKAAKAQAERLRRMAATGKGGRAADKPAKPAKPRTEAYPQPADRKAAEAGRLPGEPDDFSAPTHAGYRNKLATLTALARAGDLAALREMTIPVYDQQYPDNRPLSRVAG